MGRNPEIEKILEAWWQFDHSLPSGGPASKRQLDELLDVVVLKSKELCTRDQILDFLWPQYKAYRAEKHRAEKLAVAQSAMKK